MAWQAIQDANGALVGHEIFNRSRTASAHTMDSDLALAHAVLSHLEPAQLLATKRVVVKRPDYAPPLANVATPNAVVTKGHRFDIYAGTPV